MLLGVDFLLWEVRFEGNVANKLLVIMLTTFFDMFAAILAYK